MFWTSLKMPWRQGHPAFRFGLKKTGKTDLLLIEIVDNGRGMSEEVLQESLESFLYDAEHTARWIRPSPVLGGSAPL